MPRVAVKDNSRMSLRIRPSDKALLMRAVAYAHTDLTDFVLRNAVQAAEAVIAGPPTPPLLRRAQKQPKKRLLLIRPVPRRKSPN